MPNQSGIAKAKYVVETCCINGNVFLHGPFGSKTAAETWRSSDSWYTMENCNKIKIRMIMHPTKWTKGSS